MTLWLPYIASQAICIILPWIICILFCLSTSLGYKAANSFLNWLCIPSVIWKILGTTSWYNPTHHFSSASAKIVWLVYEKVFFTISQASSHKTPSISTKILISSGIAITGWVSLSWIAINSGIFKNSLPWIFLNFFIISCNDADTKKYCCRSLNFLPSSVESLGYNTREISSANVLSCVACK